MQPPATLTPIHQPLQGRRLVLGITGSIAAYKAAELARLLVQAGCQVRVVMTSSAQQFIGAMTLQAITGNVVSESRFDPQQEAAMGHIALARWADLILIAPASADCIAKLRAGIADTLLYTLCLASTAPVALAPAMNTNMWQHPATQKNCQGLQQRGVHCWGPAVGIQACGEQGPGRMLEPSDLLQQVIQHFSTGRLHGKQVLITAGPTHEPLDAVRFIGNRSSGKMGYALTSALLQQGANVTLVSGPVSLDCPSGATRLSVNTAQQMYDCVLEQVATADIFIACAAVADYRPATCASEKIKKQAERIQLDLVQNPDILATVAALPKPPFCLGFAAETHNLAEFAEIKRRTKKIPLLAANQVSEQQGFEADENALLVLWENGQASLPAQPKLRLAQQLVNLLADRLDAKTTTQDS
jgi:phosphopantothenoylcysteine decarboxylase/phosphopantothenate--cysteine ligase